VLPALLIFDADGTLRWTTVEGQQFPTAPHEWRLLPGVRERLRAIDWRRHKLGVASNQGGVALGHVTGPMARRLLYDMVEEALGFVPPDARILMCTCPPDRDCHCRKPRPGMLLRILRSFALPPAEALYVGDLELDREAARRAGVAFRWAREFFDGRP
jgi:D-glycero-D-manno-heptose 1,7-bisphosphate phosphatase